MSSKTGSRLTAVILGCAVFAAGGTIAFAAADSSGSAPSDSQITKQVEQKLNRDLPNSVWNLQVQTRDGVVTLSGRADTGLTEQKALQDARKVPGVADVRDNLSVQM